MEDKVILKYFEDLNSAVVLSAVDTKECFRKMGELNTELITSLQGSHPFRHAVYNEWKTISNKQKSTAKMSVDYTSGKSAVNNDLAKRINQFFQALPVIRFNSFNVQELILLKIRLSTYISIYNKLNKEGHLTAEQAELFSEIQDTRKRLVQSNLKLVVSFSKNYKDKGVSFIDLIQEGNVGLLKAIDKYSLEAGTNFSTYATWWVKQACIRLIKSQSRIHIPANVQDKMLRKRKDDKNKELDTETYERLISISTAPISLDTRSTVSDTDTYSEGLMHTIADADQVLPDEELEQKRLRDTIEKEIGILEPMVQKVLSMRFGLNGPVMSFTAIAETLGIRKELVKQLEVRGLSKLKNSALLENYLND